MVPRSRFRQLNWRTAIIDASTHSHESMSGSHKLSGMLSFLFESAPQLTNDQATFSAQITQPLARTECINHGRFSAPERSALSGTTSRI